MTTPIPTDLFNLKCRFDAWRKTRTKRTKTPEHLLAAAADLLDRYSVSRICQVCKINPRTFRRHSASSEASSRSETAPVAQFFPLSLSIPQSEQPSRDDCQLLLERPDGARLSISLPILNEALISALCSDFLHSR
jgi:hypothetical protein